MNTEGMNTAVMIRLTIVFTLSIILLAGFGVARFFDLVVQGWPALAALLGIMVGGKTMERVKELHVNAFGPNAAAKQEGDA
jgi:hypothetical protein